MPQITGQHALCCQESRYNHSNHCQQGAVGKSVSTCCACRGGCSGGGGWRLCFFIAQKARRVCPRGTCYRTACAGPVSLNSSNKVQSGVVLAHGILLVTAVVVVTVIGRSGSLSIPTVGREHKEPHYSIYCKIQGILPPTVIGRNCLQTLSGPRVPRNQ